MLRKYVNPDSQSHSSARLRVRMLALKGKHGTRNCARDPKAMVAFQASLAR